MKDPQEASSPTSQNPLPTPQFLPSHPTKTEDCSFRRQMSNNNQHVKNDGGADESHDYHNGYAAISGASTQVGSKVLDVDGSFHVDGSRTDDVRGEHHEGRFMTEESSGRLDEPIDLNSLEKKLPKFCKTMNADHKIFGFGWQSLYQVFRLPRGEEKSFSWESNATASVIQEWYKKERKILTLRSLLEVVDQTGRDDCLRLLKEELECNLELEVILSENTRGVRKKPVVLKHLGHETLRKIAEEIDRGYNKDIRAYLNSKTSPKYQSTFQLLRDAKALRIRRLTRFLRECKRSDVIKWMKDHLPSGVTGPLLKDFDENL